MNLERPPPQRRKPPSWRRKWSQQRLLHPSRNGQKCLSLRNLLSGWMLQVTLLLHPLLQNPTITHPRKQRNPSKGWSPTPHQPPTQISPVTGSGPTLQRAARYLTGGGNSGPFAAKPLNDTHDLAFEMKRLPPSIDWIPGLPGCPGGEAGWNGGAGPGFSMVHHTIRNTHRGTVQSSPGTPQMPCPSAWERQSVRYCHVECGGEGSCDSYFPYRNGLFTRAREETRTLGGRANCPTSPSRQEASEPEGVAHSGELAIVQRQLPPAPPGFPGSWSDKSNPPPKVSWLTSWYTPGGMAAPELLGVPTGNSLPQLHGGRGMVPIPVQGDFSDISAAGSFWILRPVLTTQKTPSKDNASWLTYEWINPPNQPMSE